jgi:hypothetical protein
MSTPAWHIEVATPGDGAASAGYVGLFSSDGCQTLCLPIGYPVSGDERYASLGLLNRTIAHFCSLAQTSAQACDRDGYFKGDDGLRLAPGDLRAPGYSRVGSCIALMRLLQNPRLLSVARQAGLRDEFNDRHIGKSLEHAQFLSDGTPVFERMWGQRSQTQQSSDGIVGLASWLAMDALLHLFPDLADTALSSSLRAEWEVLARRFASNAGLSDQASLFVNGSARTLDVLLAEFDMLRRCHPVSFADTQQLHDLVDDYLGHALQPGGTVYGLSSFHQVWEAACLHHARLKFGDAQIFTCDDTFASGVAPSTRRRWLENRKRVFAHNGTQRRPDLVVQRPDGYLIVDFKYSQAFDPGSSFYRRRPPSPDLDALSQTGVVSAAALAAMKAHQDIGNLETHRWLLMQHQLGTCDESGIGLELWVPAEHAAEQRMDWKAWGTGGSIHGSDFQNLLVRFQSVKPILAGFAEQFRFF